MLLFGVSHPKGHWEWHWDWKRSNEQSLVGNRQSSSLWHVVRRYQQEREQEPELEMEQNQDQKLQGLETGDAAAATPARVLISVMVPFPLPCPNPNPWVLTCRAGLSWKPATIPSTLAQLAYY